MNDHQFHAFIMEGITLLATSRGGLYELDPVAAALWQQLGRIKKGTGTAEDIDSPPDHDNGNRPGADNISGDGPVNGNGNNPPHPFADAARALQGLYPPDAIHRAQAELDSIVHNPATAPGDPIMPARRLRAMCLLVAQCCNLACDYCFAQGGGYGARGGLMDESTACRAVDLLLEESGSTTNLQVDFFGGEPLLNLPVVQKTIE